MRTTTVAEAFMLSPLQRNEMTAHELPQGRTPEFGQLEVVVIDGERYYSSMAGARHGARGRVNYFDIRGAEGIVSLQKHDYSAKVLKLTDELFGEGDVWWVGRPRQYDPPNFVASNTIVREMSMETWYSRLRSDTLVVDWRIITHARGRAGGGRGKTERPAMIELETIEIGGAKSQYFEVWSTNSTGEYDALGDFHHGKALMHLVLQPTDTVYVAGRQFIFTNREMAEDASKHGAIGRMPEEVVDVEVQPDTVSAMRRDLFDHGIEGDEVDIRVTNAIQALRGL